MINKTQPKSKSKRHEPSLDEYMERLGRLAGETRVAAILRWMGVSSSSYSNWRRRGTIPYKTLVNTLLNHRISLDWFFAPYTRLEIPVLTDNEVEEGAKTYLQEQNGPRTESDKVIRAYSDCKAILERNRAPVSDQSMRLMLDVYLDVGDRAVRREQILETLAQSLKQAGHGS